MVNTFIISDDIRQSIKLLDNRRLGKQRVEAQQILNLLLDAIYICDELDWNPQPKGFDLEHDIAREEWFKNVFKQYKSLPFFIAREGRVIQGGWATHTAVLMWIGYEEALKEYITLCIQEWKRRGFKNTMTTYEVSNPVYPWWTRNTTLINSHISALLRKEKVRKESKWYWEMNDFVKISQTKWYSTGYLWISHLTLEQRKKLSICDDPSLCDPQTNDFV